jgi:hypothetical protein
MQKKQAILWLTSSYPRYEQDSASIFLRYLAETIDNKIFDLHILSPDNQYVDNSLAASHGERTRGLVVPRRRRAVVLSES